MQSTATATTSTKTDRALEDRMIAFAGDEERVEVLARARSFKRSWIELAQALAGVYERGSWSRWGYPSFDAYCRNELALTPSTAAKLLGSYRFLRASAPRVVERAVHEPTAPVPSLRAVDFVAKATERGAAPEEALHEIRRAAFEEGVDAPALRRRFKAVAFPVSDQERDERVRAQIVTCARKLAHLVAEPAAQVPGEAARAVEEAIGQLLEAMDQPR